VPSQSMCNLCTISCAACACLHVQLLVMVVVVVIVVIVIVEMVVLAIGWHNPTYASQNTVNTQCRYTVKPTSITKIRRRQAPYKGTFSQLSRLYRAT
jgi:hypothetical protein